MYVLRSAQFRHFKVSMLCVTKYCSPKLKSLECSAWMASSLAFVVIPHPCCVLGAVGSSILAYIPQLVIIHACSRA